MTMPFAEYPHYDATALAALIRNGEVSASEVLESAIFQAEKLNPALNAIITPLYDHARLQLHRADQNAPFYGVPFLLKDLLSQLEGTPYSAGSRALQGYISRHTTSLVQRFEQNGLLIMGKTNTPELGLMGTTEPKAFGATHNPWRGGYSSGGSSGGSAAAVAAGIVPLASGGDGGGSIRIPASACGLFGLKPSRARTPCGPDYGEVWDGASVEHVITRSVRDSAAILDLSNGMDGGAAHPIDHISYSSALEKPVRKLRIALCSNSPLGTPVNKHVVHALQQTAQLLKDLGHEVEEACPEIRGADIARAYLHMYFAHMAADLTHIGKMVGKPWHKLPVELTTHTLARFGFALSAGDYVLMKHTWNQLARAMARFHQQYDIYLTPVMATLPLPHGSFAHSWLDNLSMHLVNALHLHGLALKTSITEEMAYKSLEKLPFTQLANLTGQPAMSVPLFCSHDNLPIGSQFIAPMGDELTLLQLARQLEEACPWAQRLPAVR